MVQKKSWTPLWFEDVQTVTHTFQLPAYSTAPIFLFRVMLSLYTFLIDLVHVWRTGLYRKKSIFSEFLFNDFSALKNKFKGVSADNRIVSNVTMFKWPLCIYKTLVVTVANCDALNLYSIRQLHIQMPAMSFRFWSGQTRMERIAQNWKCLVDLHPSGESGERWKCVWTGFLGYTRSYLRWFTCLVYKRKLCYLTGWSTLITLPSQCVPKTLQRPLLPLWWQVLFWP